MNICCWACVIIIFCLASILCFCLNIIIWLLIIRCFSIIISFFLAPPSSPALLNPAPLLAASLSSASSCWRRLDAA